MIIGKSYLVHLGDWHTIVGRVVSQIGPITYVMEYVSKIHDTHAGDNWEKLLDDSTESHAARQRCEYRHYTTPVTITLTIAAFEWLGRLPQEQDT